MLSSYPVRAMLATAKPEAATRFYRDVLGLELVQDYGTGVLFSLSGDALLHLQKVETFTPHAFTALGWSVPDLRAAISQLAAVGVVFERFTGMAQDEHGVWRPPGSNGGVCWFKDPDGNLLSLTEAA